MVQLVELSVPIPEVRGSNTAIGKISIEHWFTINCIEKTKIKKKRAGIAQFCNSKILNINYVKS